MVDAKANFSASLDGYHHSVIELEPQEMYRRGLLIRRASKIFVGHRKYLIVAPTNFASVEGTLTPTSCNDIATNHTQSNIVYRSRARLQCAPFVRSIT